MRHGCVLVCLLDVFTLSQKMCQLWQAVDTFKNDLRVQFSLLCHFYLLYLLLNSCDGNDTHFDINLCL